MRNRKKSAAPQTRGNCRRRHEAAAPKVTDFAALPPECVCDSLRLPARQVLANVLAKLDFPWAAVQLQRVSRSFWRAGGAGEKLENVMLNKLLYVQSADGRGATADGRGRGTVQAACAARRWLARNAAGVKLICGRVHHYVPACTSLVPCLPALEEVTLNLGGPLHPDKLGCLLEALAWCPRLRALDLIMYEIVTGDGVDVYWPFAAYVFGQLRSLTKLALAFSFRDPYTLADVVGALVSLTGLAELSINLPQPAVVPAALGQLKSLRSLLLRTLKRCVFEAGCLELPNLLSLACRYCAAFEDAEVLSLTGVTALQHLSRIDFTTHQGPCFDDSRCTKLSRQPFVIPLGLLSWPADMGILSLSLLHLDISGHRLAHFPVALTQLVALECLKASGNEFVELPSAITALSRLTELALGRVASQRDPLQLQGVRPLNVATMGDLSGFPALCKLTFSFCEVKLCMSLSAVRHTSLASIVFEFAHPAPVCVPMVLQLSLELRQSNMLSLAPIRGSSQCKWADDIVQDLQTLPPFYKFQAALELCVQ